MSNQMICYEKIRLLDKKVRIENSIWKSLPLLNLKEFSRKLCVQKTEAGLVVAKPLIYVLVDQSLMVFAVTETEVQAASFCKRPPRRMPCSY